MNSKKTNILKKLWHKLEILKRIYKIYFFAIIVYVIPFILLGIFIIDEMTVNKTGAMFWALFLMSLLPCSLIVFVLSAIGLKKAIKNKNNFNKDMGTSGIVGGLILLFGGILGAGLLYIVLS